MKIKKIDFIGIQKVYNTNVDDNGNYVSENGIVHKNCVVDSEYRGILKLHLFNHSNMYVPIKKGEKIVQAIVMPIWTGQPILVDELDLNSKRGEGGFGSTDKN
jgi:dUTP pyrophosphatase